MAALRVLEAAGCEVVLPNTGLCCGRALYDFGLLDEARQQLHDILEAHTDDILAGVPVVGLEPSCVAVFRDELRQLFPTDARAQRLAAQSYTLGEYLELLQWRPTKPAQGDRGEVLYHAHCHQKAVLTVPADVRLLQAAGYRVNAPDTGCCGMAGSFGFKPDHYDVSQQIGERVLLPAVRAADSNTLIVSNGFSCREQIEQGTGRETLHLSEVLARTLVEP